ncbi:MAG TPA: 50S ribosomal protein L11 [Planctomycetota bacterium]|nr:50S ribosomal protein L11 [Planctomycetota bacterium]
MAKDIKAVIKLQCPGGAATPAPPVGPALGQHGVNIGQFVKRFNDETKKWSGETIPVIITVYTDRSFDLEYKQPPASRLILSTLKLEKASSRPQDLLPGVELTKKQIEEIAKRKMPDMNTKSVPAAMKMIAGTARSMGIKTQPV